jgi:signal transduction histidine kinase
VRQLLDEHVALRRAAASGTLDPAAADRAARLEETIDLAYLTEQIPRSIERTLEGVGRVAEIVRAMKEFAHEGREDKAPADLNRGLEGTLIMAHNEVKYVADVATDFGELPPVTCRIGEINQVFLNLLVNAAHAIRAKVGDSGAKGSITVRSRRDGGEHVRVEIADTGTGIHPEIRGRVFEPFFTTKQIGCGTGQGLALARAIVVDKHGGTIDFDSEPGVGTTFVVRLPIETAPAAERDAR